MVGFRSGAAWFAQHGCFLARQLMIAKRPEGFTTSLAERSSRERSATPWKAPPENEIDRLGPKSPDIVSITHDEITGLYAAFPQAMACRLSIAMTWHASFAIWRVNPTIA
jgi:hypothetical protein